MAPDQLEMTKALGKGFFGEVWKSTEKRTGRVFAVKKVPIKVLQQHKLMDQMEREISSEFAFQGIRGWTVF